MMQSPIQRSTREGAALKRSRRREREAVHTDAKSGLHPTEDRINVLVSLQYSIM